MYGPGLSANSLTKSGYLWVQYCYFRGGNGADKLRYISSETTPWSLVSFERVAISKMVKN
jgi:hypothetical protein